MFKRNVLEQERALASRLREEVDLSRPEFSQALHDRICESPADAAARS